MAEQPSTTEQAATAVTVTTGIVTTAAGPQEVKPCPRPAQWSDLPHLDRDALPVFLYIVECLPGTATSTGCPASKAFYTIAVPWTRVVKEGWTAPGGNRYFAEHLRADTRDPRVQGLLKRMAYRSRDRFVKSFSNAPFKNMTVEQLINFKGSDRLAVKYGHATVNKRPLPGEKVGDFIKRGGYLLMIDGGPFKGSEPLEVYSAKWFGPDISKAEIWASYNAGGNQISYSIRIVYKGAWDRAVNGVDAWLRKNAAKMCAKLSGTEMQTVAGAMAAFPATQPYVAAYGAALAVCNIPWNPPPCIPQPPQPGEYVVPNNPTYVGTVTVQSPKGGTIWGQRQDEIKSLSQGVMATGWQPIPPNAPGAPSSNPPPPSPYPPGTIAWYDVAARGYRIAVPDPGPGTTHRAISAGALPSLPAVGIRLVNKTEWETATMPWLQRPRNKAIVTTASIAAIAGATALYLNRA